MNQQTIADLREGARLLQAHGDSIKRAAVLRGQCRQDIEQAERDAAPYWNSAARLTAIADSMEKAAPVEWQMRFFDGNVWSRWINCSQRHHDALIARKEPDTETRSLYPHPPAPGATGAVDPCPTCPPGAVCKTPTCGRLNAVVAPAQTGSAEPVSSVDYWQRRGHICKTCGGHGFIRGGSPLHHLGTWADKCSDCDGTDIWSNPSARVAALRKS